ncbi:MaoC family dehydratase N-terminal domain-containing protein [Polynucleobacter sp. MG-Unter2-18]|uniref:FAS1-like dehydratase domain-containing protein n=1 Tax=Polynucleobacter sp. MG-Unter2-18 TaxID=2081052 RepID=UPI001BFECBFF|nr:MaoC family dehydratase N-terminal domain-containing protein [Polynucleobacter sp. MG-Unter2-18]QWD95185.1 MaoC family dehydratase N-terminal domain-containing protein [Polynucleobacter sp. MG-Unter2-18]
MELMRIEPQTITHLQEWLGKTETLQDIITAAPVRALSATLDRPDVAPVAGTFLPELWHWLYFLPCALQSEIGLDGHPKRGGFLPPVPLPRRMWAGSRVEWLAPLAVDDEIERVSRIESVTHKAGRTGDLIFVLVKHTISNQNGLALVEEHDIVYRDAPGPDDKPVAPTPAPTGATWSKTITPDDVLLFRYSALTFNGHRIHYDRKYVTEVEGYPGLIVHGPLIATLLVDLVRQSIPGCTLKSFEFRAIRPTFDINLFKVSAKPDLERDTSGKTISIWAEDHEGWLTMQATAVLA